ncbi:MAG: uracil-DNA glycosylase, partial [Oscillospiraceae bacterium]|nr:uracil-DNA glycosylase [Oscillospiraceae bacterium]
MIVKEERFRRRSGSARKEQIMEAIGNDWDELLKEEWNAPYFRKLQSFLDSEQEAHNIYPDKADIFAALKLTAYSEVKAVILGQDPYHGVGQAQGLCFSVKDGVPIPPSLKNIFKELYNDCGILPPTHGDLSGWAKQGVLLLNTV